jgi:hypothetical protein
MLLDVGTKFLHGLVALVREFLAKAVAHTAGERGWATVRSFHSTQTIAPRTSVCRPSVFEACGFRRYSVNHHGEFRSLIVFANQLRLSLNLARLKSLCGNWG